MPESAPQNSPARPAEYEVVARRYRPQTFVELIGQEHIARGLSNAILTNRVGHAYLFTGPRGVGKTSAARILAKALDCVHGPTPTPCNVCEICQGISSGDDVDVVEMDGASNRGIDEIRQLRQNVNVRPSRARFKIYIIDEVHMLTREAFNALLKTLEEPPEHVKFIFCTTEVDRIPITILSRCQRFDFAGIQTASIAQRLQQIIDTEGVEADQEALELLARRAAGSMRDSQSLLEQLLAFGKGKITAADVHEMLGTANDARLGQLVRAIVARDSAAALKELDGALGDGVDPGQLLEQLLGYLRDCMAAAVGCLPESFLHVSPSEQAAVVEASRQLGLETILAVIQIVDQTLARLKYSVHARVLAEMALVRSCKLEDLDALPGAIAQLRAGTSVPLPARAAAPPAAAAERNTWQPGSSPQPTDPKKKERELTVEASTQGSVASVSATASRLAAAGEPLTAESDSRAAPPTSGSNATETWTLAAATEIWQQVRDQLSGLAAQSTRCAVPQTIRAIDRLTLGIPASAKLEKSFCERPDQLAELEKALTAAAGRRIRLEFVTIADDFVAAPVEPRRTVSPRQRLAEKSQHALVRRVVELFDARVVRVDEPPESPPSEPGKANLSV